MQLEKSIDMKQKLICIGGIPGIGKTTIGYEILKNYSGNKPVLICPDEIRLEIIGKAKNELITNDDISMEVTLKVIDKMYKKTKESLKLGLDVIVPSAFILEKMRVGFEKIAKDYEADFHGLWLEAPYDVIKERAISRAKKYKTPNNKEESNSVSAVIPDKKTVIDGEMKWQVIDANQSIDIVVSDISKHISLSPLTIKGNIQDSNFIKLDEVNGRDNNELKSKNCIKNA